ncbi:MAG: hypothetical protein ACTSPB_25300, partial [Candidatus Thorarchaeota archaeon]
MPRAEEVAIKIKLENGQVIKGVAEIERKMKEMSTKGEGVLSILKSKWLAVTAAIGGTVFAVKRMATAIINLSREAAYLNQIRMAFDSMADTAGVSSEKILQSMRELSGGTISTMDLIQSATRAMILGIPIDKLDQLMRVARASATAMGADVRQMFDDIVVGIGRQSKLILDNLGIVVKMEEAYARYAEQLGKTSRQLTEAEKRQAFLNAVLEEGERIIRQVGKAGQELTPAETFQRFQAALQDLRAEIGQRFLPTISAAIEKMTSFIRKIDDFLKRRREAREMFEEITGGLEEAVSVLDKYGIKTVEDIGKIEDEMKKLEAMRA